MSETNGNGKAVLHGKTALVTGASRGIGRAIALHLASLGADVAVTYCSKQSDAEVVAREICQMGRRTMVVQGHVGNPAEARNFVKRVLDEWGRLDILVNNAGITHDKSIRKMTDDDWHEVLQVNLDGVFYCVTAAIPAMIAQKFGRIINVSSYGCQGANFGQANYAASKGAVVAFTKVLAIELAKYNITANCVSPGFTDTDMFNAVSTEIKDQIKAKIPMGRFATPEDIANAAGYLAAHADYVTGTQINVNGGIYFN